MATVIKTGFGTLAQAQVYDGIANGDPPQWPWTSLDNAKTENGLAAYQSCHNTGVNGWATYWLICTNWAFAIPAGDTIQSLLLEAKVMSLYHDGPVEDPPFYRLYGWAAAQLIHAGVRIGSPMAPGVDFFPTGSMAWGQHPVNQWGTWGASLTPDIVNDPSFGVIWGCIGWCHDDPDPDSTGWIDTLRMTIQHSGSGGYQHKLLGVPGANIASIMGVPIANVAKFNGV